MKPQPIHRLDQAILSHCVTDHALLSDLLGSFPRGTLYRHVEKLLAAGLLSKQGRIYRTTEHGKCRLAELTVQMHWDIWDQIYAPVRYVPSVQHRALFELTLAAVVARQAQIREDHHAGFVLMGPTLAWKTSEATFLSHTLGLDPTKTIIDLTTESGRSLLIRRDGRGNVPFKRDLLDGPLICFDDLLEVQPSLRPVVHPFFSGRIVLPVDNSVLRIGPVPFITLNPRDEATLEGQTSFSTAQLRRLVVLNLNKTALPDLAMVGHRALEAAVKHGPLQLPTPQIDAQAYRPHIVGLVREILLPNVLARVDTEMLATLVSGMSGFIPDPERAIQQTLYDFATTVETLGWTTLGWSDVVSRFSLHTPVLRHRQEKTIPPPEENHIILWRSAMDGFRESALPPFVISDENKARLIAIASQENIPLERVDHALEVILDSWNQRQRDGHTLDEAYSALQLMKELRERTIAVQDVKLAAKLRQVFRESSYTSDDFDAALDLLPLLREQGLTVQDDRLEPMLGIAARLLNSDRSLTEFEAWLTAHSETDSQKKEENGVDQRD